MYNQRRNLIISKYMHVDKFISHRGANSYFIENTLEALKLLRILVFIGLKQMFK